MRRSRSFWAVVLIVVGVLLLLQQMGITLIAWGLIWPLVLIALGAWVLWGAARGRPEINAEQVAIPLGSAERARVRVDYGAGRLNLAAGAGVEELLSGTFTGGVDHRERQEGDTLVSALRTPEGVFGPFMTPWSWGGGHGLEWNVRLNAETPMALELHTGASATTLDLSALKVTDLSLETGASSTEVTVPARAGLTRMTLKAGVAAVNIHVPAGVGARIRVQSGLGAIHVDEARFPNRGGVHQSDDYDTAENKVDMVIEMGLGSVDVR
jgi:hypothetical protein